MFRDTYQNRGRVVPICRTSSNAICFSCRNRKWGSFCCNLSAGQHPEHGASSCYQSFPLQLGSCQDTDRRRAQLLSGQSCASICSAGSASAPRLWAAWAGCTDMARWLPHCSHSSELLWAGTAVVRCHRTWITKQQEGSCTGFTQVSLGLRGKLVQQQQSHGWLIRALKEDRNRKGKVTSVTSSAVYSVWFPGSTSVMVSWECWIICTEQTRCSDKPKPTRGTGSSSASHLSQKASRRHPRGQSDLQPCSLHSCRAQRQGELGTIHAKQYLNWETSYWARVTVPKTELKHAT